MISDAAEHVGEIGVGLGGVELGGLDDGVEHGGAFAADQSSLRPVPTRPQPAPSIVPMIEIVDTIIVSSHRHTIETRQPLNRRPPPDAYVSTTGFSLSKGVTDKVGLPKGKREYCPFGLHPPVVGAGLLGLRLGSNGWSPDRSAETVSWRSDGIYMPLRTLSLSRAGNRSGGFLAVPLPFRRIQVRKI